MPRQLSGVFQPHLSDSTNSAKRPCDGAACDGAACLRNEFPTSRRFSVWRWQWWGANGRCAANGPTAGSTVQPWKRYEGKSITATAMGRVPVLDILSNAIDLCLRSFKGWIQWRRYERRWSFQQLKWTWKQLWRKQLRRS